MKTQILDYGAGNILNVSRALSATGMEVELVGLPEKINHSDIMVLPGVGAFKSCMTDLEKSGFVEKILWHVEQGGVLVGICVGMQMLFQESEEHGPCKGLGLLEGTVNKLPNVSVTGAPLRLPHIGWTKLIGDEPSIAGGFAYFVHSYRARLQESQQILAWCEYGGHEIPAIVKKGRILGFQFHPERSGSYGLSLLGKMIAAT